MRKFPKKTIFYSILLIAIIALFPLTYYKLPKNGIIIEEDKDFRKYMLPGKGTVDNPYRIENIEFKSQIAITISYTSKVFIIQNCVFLNLELGIELRHLANNTYKISDCLFENIRGGAIMAFDIFNGTVEIEDCIFKESGQAIRSDVCDDIIINNNTFQSNEIALYVNTWYPPTDYKNQVDDRISITNNTLLDNIRGIRILHTEYVQIENNHLHNNTHYWSGYPVFEPGFQVLGSTSLSLINNTLEEETVRIEIYENQYYENLIIENVTIDGVLFKFIKDSSNIEIDEKSPYYLFYNCVNVTFSNLNLSEDISSARMILAECNNISLINCSFEGYDISFSNCTDISINNIETYYGGIYFRYCLDVKLSEVEIDMGTLRISSSVNFEIEDIQVMFFQGSYGYYYYSDTIFIIYSSNINVSNATTFGGSTAIYMYNASHVLIQDSYFTSLDYNQVFVINYCEDIIIINNLIEKKVEADLVGGDYDENDIINNNTIVYIG